MRSLLEQSATVWHSSTENKDDLARVQRSAVKIIMGERYNGYKKALAELEIETLEQWREKLCLNFALKCAKNEKTKKMFPLNEKQHKMNTRNTEKSQVQHANTERLKNSPLIYMQNLLNDYETN